MSSKSGKKVMGKSRGRPKQSEGRTLDRSLIVAHTLKLVDEEGLEGLSMRRLGQSLGVDPMAVYHYIPNKAALLDALVEAVMKEIRLPDDFLSVEPQSAVTMAARAYWSALHAHPRAVPVLSSRPALNAGSLEYVEKVLTCLLAAGFSERRALDTMNAVGNYIRGCLLMDSSHSLDDKDHQHDELPTQALDMENFPSLLRVIQKQGTAYHPERTFLAGLEILIRGLFSGTEK